MATIFSNKTNTLPLTTFADHRVQNVWDKHQTDSVLDKRYLVYYPSNVGWQILDLASENITPKSFTSPYNIKPRGVNRTFDFEKNIRAGFCIEHDPAHLVSFSTNPRLPQDENGNICLISGEV